MQPGGIICVIVCCFLLTAGCIQLPGIHIISNTPDPIIGQWIGGEPPATDRHIIFYENQTFFSVDYFLNRGETTDSGTWTRKEPGLYATQSVTGEITNWVYDSSDDSVYMSRLPLKKYYRFKG
ncbi:MAG: hypothetical protein ACYDEZ_01625 [Methanoregula sp.]|jgi:hypothetical protein